jgi:hypothetical protein
MVELGNGMATIRNQKLFSTKNAKKFFKLNTALIQTARDKQSRF